MKWCIFLVTAGIFLACEGRELSRCDLVRELRRYGFSENQMRDWVCLVENESSRRTDVIGKPNSDGSRDYGLFQINDRYWCSNTNTPGKDCNVTCKQLLSNNIRDSAVCAQKIFRRHGFNAWYGWANRCRGKPLPDIRSC
ncbi:PREDICTED: lysozyme-like [Papilio polytes]|uniref:lysozyme-like n=1 Tax=Papilio polytes TaxID=76194 RepID=UPI000675D4B8|nr:PREDICTED: lysozyme-like [Papilio polytes]